MNENINHVRQAIRTLESSLHETTQRIELLKTSVRILAEQLDTIMDTTIPAKEKYWFGSGKKT